MSYITIAVDAMGGDQGPDVTIPAVLVSLQQQANLAVILVGDQARLQKVLTEHHAELNDRLCIQHASQQVEMTDLPSQALRTKKDSSMRVAINLVKEGKAQACVSSGNTGALMATARFVLKTLPGIERPAISVVLPTMKGTTKVRVLDLGANVDCSAEHLLQFAIMGSVLATAVDKVEKPTVGLLNIGEEEIKGNDQVKQAAQLLSQHQGINYIGFVEGDEIYKGVADIIVCDGFVGNVALKVTEGVAKLIAKYMREAFNRNWFTRISGLAAIHVLKGLGKKIDPARYNGASLLGLQGIVVKSHGSANSLAFAHAVKQAVLEVEQNVPRLIDQQVADLLQ